MTALPPLPENDDRLLDLLAEQATAGLAADESRELELLLAQNPGLDAEVFDLAVAELDEALFPPGPELEVPAELRDKLLAAGEAFLAGQNNAAVARFEAETSSPLTPPAADSGPLLRAPAPASSAPPEAGWLVALVLAVIMVLGISSVTLSPGRPQPVPTTGTDPSLGPDPVAALEELQREAQDLVTAEFGLVEPEQNPLGAESKVQGQVFWSSERQEGYLRFQDLPANAPARQYQLWIVDTQTFGADAGFNRVDGGTFTVPADTTEVIVPIQAKLDVPQAEVFAITEERAGGVVRSKGPLLLAAAP